MIQKFRRRFIAISTCALFVVLLTIMGGMLGVSYYKASQQVTNVLNVLASHDGQIDKDSVTQVTVQKRFGPNTSKESLFQYRYFSVFFDKSGNITKIDSGHIATVDQDAITDMAHWAYKQKKVRGHTDYGGTTYAYKLTKKSNGKVSIIFLDESVIMASANELMKFAAAMGIVSLLLFTLVLIAFSNRAIQPIIEAEKRQKEFITNAGHELKTPLAIIETNTELSEMISGETEWTTSNKQQVARLTRLINNLISLARFDEQPEMTIATIDASAAVQRAADSFEAMITHEGKGFSTNIAPGVKVRADENYFYELCNILLDNANKYCDDGWKVSVLLRENKTTRAVTLEVGNTYAEGKAINYTKFFNRFYRDDTSHNSKKRGYGIGLSMAQTLVHAFKGKISARYKNQTLYFTIRLKMTK